MTESDSFPSLLALVDSHLSTVSVTETKPKDINEKIYRARQINGNQTTTSENLIVSPIQSLTLPDYGISNDINDVLARQISNMLIAKEQKIHKEGKYRLDEEMCKVEVNESKDDMIDLIKVLQTPVEKPLLIEKSLSSSSSSLESLLKENTKDFECASPQSKMSFELETLPKLLPCTTDMSYLLWKKIPQAKASAFGLVLTSRYRPVAAPYLKEKIGCHIRRFDFSTKSPCDIIKEKLRKPSMGNPNYVNIMDIIMG